MQTTPVYWVVVEIVASLVAIRPHPVLTGPTASPLSVSSILRVPAAASPVYVWQLWHASHPPSGNSGMLGILSPPSATIANNALTFKMPWEWGFAVALMVFFYCIFAYFEKNHNQLGAVHK